MRPPIRTDLRPICTDLRPIRTDLRPIRADLRPIRTRFAPRHLTSERLQLSLCRPGGTQSMSHGLAFRHCRVTFSRTLRGMSTL